MEERKFINKRKGTLLRLFAMLCIFSCFSFAAFGQKRVTGKVADASGEAIIGASILEKGTTNGIVTDINGDFSLAVGDNAVLQISYIGFITQEVAVGNRTQINITLAENVEALDEVIVVGYGTMKKSDLTGAVGRVTMDATAKLPNTSLAQTLSGASAGVSINPNGADEGNATISIRGKTSLSANDDPLIILDGIIYNGSINNINVNDIEYIDILKDASAAAVYGSRSANGVVLITTKKGKQGKPRIQFNAYYGVQGAGNVRPEVMNAEQYALRMTDYYYQQELYAWYKTNPTSDAGKPAYPNVADRTVVAQSLRTQEERDMYIPGGYDIDWVDVALADNPTIQSYDASFSGATDRVNYYVSASYTGEERILVNDLYDRYTFNTKVDGKLTNWLSAGLNVNYSYRDYSGMAASLNDARVASPLAKVTDPNYPESVYLTGENYMPHPMRGLLVDDVDIRNELFFVGNFKIEVPWVKGLTYDFNYSNTYNNRKRNRFYPVTTSNGVGTNGQAQRRPEETRSWIYNNIITYDNTFGDHHIQGTLLYSREKYAGESYVFTSEYFENPILGFSKMDMGTKLSTSDNKMWEEMGVSYMGRVNYQFKKRYMAGATVRRDGFSGFGANNKFVTLPSFSLAWVASEESFIQESLPWLYAKLRLSYGQNGNQGIGRYSSFAQMSTQSYVYGSTSVVGVYPSVMGNSSLRWEKTNSYNLGIDYGFFDRRINGSIELYLANTSDVLVKRKMPWSSGYEEIWTNIGGIQNKGIEVQLNAGIIETQDFQWDMGVNFTLNRDKITKLYGGENDIDVGNSWFVGEPIRSIYDYKMAGGLWTEQDLYSGNILSGWYPGQYKYVDTNGDGSITVDDRQIIGTRTPNYSFSVSNTFNYKNWSLYVFINSIQGGNGYYLWNNYDYVNVSSRSDDVYRINQSAVRPYWTPTNGVNNATGVYNSPAVTSGVYEDRSFVRLQDVSLSYSFSPKVLKFLGGLEYLQLYLAGKNLYNWTNFSYWDPEYVSENSGADSNSSRPHLPATRNVVFGVKLAF
ncbi:MAG: TonB-dependent receptor [Tannerella sp.]|jgi:TonB-linked SusC/RagA family outer membrane protein|nr:TonB-dependent receptor [Tannerella sp.]